MVNEIMGFLIKLYYCWLQADFIIFAFSMLFSLVGGLESALAEALMSLAFGAFPFPFSILIGWTINPLVIIFQIVITIALFYFEEGTN